MANYNKSFNFRNGVQVDNDNFIVNSAGLVGIGTTIPTDYLDVYGTSTFRDDIKITGLVTSSNLYVSGISTILGNVGIGTTNIDIAADSNNNTILNAGIVTANFYYGSGLYLDDVVGFTTEGWNIVTPEGGAVRTGLSTTFKIGIGTTQTIEKFDLVIGADPDTPSNEGIGLAGNAGNIRATGIVTAGIGFTGSLSGDVTGNVTGDVTYSSGISSFTTLIVGSGITLTSIASTFVNAVDIDGSLDVDGHTELDNVNVSGFSTFSSAIDADDDLDVDGHTELDDVNVSGVSTFASDVSIADKIIHTGDINTALRFPAADTITAETAGSERVRIASDGKVGIGTSGPTSDLQIKSSTAANLQVTSGTAQAVIAVGKSSNIDGFNSQLRYGYDGGSFKYSDNRSLDLVNYGYGNFNHILNPNLGIATGNFHWLHGENVDPLMTLTWQGQLGIGITEPLQDVHIVGVTTFQGEVYTSTNVIVGNDLTVTGNLNITGGNFSGDVIGDIKSPDGSLVVDNGTGTGDNARVYANTYKLTGISTFSLLDASSVGIGTTADSDYYFRCGLPTEPQNNLFADTTGHLGIRTNESYAGYGDSIGLAVMGGASAIVEDRIGIGTTTPRCALDVGIGATQSTARFMILPKVSSVERGNLVGLSSGALIYNTTTGKLNFYNGAGAWETVTSS